MYIRTLLHQSRSKYPLERKLYNVLIFDLILFEIEYDSSEITQENITVNVMFEGWKEPKYYYKRSRIIGISFYVWWYL